MIDASNIKISESEQAEILKAEGKVTVSMAGQLSVITGCNGWMDYVFSTGDTDTVGTLTVVMGSARTYLPVHKEFYVMEEAVFDAMYQPAAEGPLQGTTAGNTLDVTATGAAGVDWGNVENPTTTVDLSATDIQLVDTVTTLTGHTAQTGDSFARLGAPVDLGSGAFVSSMLSNMAGPTFAAGTDSQENIRNDVAGLNNIDGSAVTLHAGTHSNVTIQGVSNNIVTAINTDVIDAAALNADFRAEMWDIAVPELPQAAPGATPSALTAMSILQMALRNRVDSDATQKTFFNNAGTVIWKKLLTDDDTDYSEAEGISGP